MAFKSSFLCLATGCLLFSGIFSAVACLPFSIALAAQPEQVVNDSLLWHTQASQDRDWRQNNSQRGQRPGRQLDKERLQQRLQKRREEIRKELQSLPPEQRAKRMQELRKQFRQKREEMVRQRTRKFRERWQNASPEEKQKFCANVRQRCADGGSKACQIAERACGNF